MSSKTNNLYFSLVNYILHKEMAYINMPGIYCKGIPPIFCHVYGALICWEKNILLNFIYLCLQKHNPPYIERNILTSSFKFILSWTFCIQIFLNGLTMKHYITHLHYSYCLDFHVLMYSIWHINPCENVCEIKNYNDPNTVHRLIQV